MTEPSDDDIRAKIEEILSTLNLEDTGFKKFLKILSTAFGGVDLKGRKAFVKEALTEALLKQAEEEEGEDEVSDGDDSVELPTPFKKKGGGGLAAKKEISPALQEFLQQGDQMSRTDIVKSLWAYIREHNLQNPANRQEILLDAKMESVFGVKKFTMFTMNKYIGAHIHPFKPVDLTPSPKKKRQAPKSSSGSAKKARKSGTQPPYRLSDALAAVTGKDILPRPQVVSKIWDYIRAHGLQNPDDKREILCDEKLRLIMGNKAKVTMFKMNTFISDHLIEKVNKDEYQHEDD